MDPRLQPFPGKLTIGQAEEVRRLRREGVPLADLAANLGVAKSSISAVVKYKAHESSGTLRIALPTGELALLRELADDGQLPVESVAAEILVEALRSRAW